MIFQQLRGQVKTGKAEPHLLKPVPSSNLGGCWSPNRWEVN